MGKLLAKVVARIMTKVTMVILFNAMGRIVYYFLLYNPGGIGFVTNKQCKETLKMEKLKKLILDYDINIT